jgi:hypothetical protein
MKMINRLKQYLSDFVSLLLPPPENGQLHGWMTICGVIAFLIATSFILYPFG